MLVTPMAYPKLVDLLSQLDEKDTLSLKQFIQERIDLQSNLMKTFLYLINNKRHIELIKNVSVINEALFINIKDKVISNHLSNLYLLSEEWMVHNQLKSEKFTIDYLLLRWQKKKGLLKIADQTAKRLEKRINDQKGLSIENLHSASHLLNYYLIQNDNKEKDYPEEKLKYLFSKYTDAVKSQYLIFMTEFQNLMSIHQGDYNEVLNQIQKFINFLPQSDTSHLLSNLYELVINEDIEALHFLKDNLLENKIDHESQLHYLITSYCYQRVMRLWSKGKHNDLSLVNAIFTYSIEHNIFTKNGKIPSAAFHSFVTQIAFNGRDYNQTELFILTWIDKVDTNKKEATIALARAQNCLYTERYEEIFQYTWRSDFDTFNQKNLAQGIHLIAAFMFREKERDVFENALHLSQLFIKRNKLKMSTHIYESYKNLCHFMQTIHQNRKDNINLDHYKPIIYRSWCEKVLKGSA